MPLRGRGGVGPLMANAILNFHFDFLTPSLIQSPTPASKIKGKAVIQTKKVAKSSDKIFIHNFGRVFLFRERRKHLAEVDHFTG